MWQRFKKFNWPVFLFVAFYAIVAVALFITNYEIGTYLIGWDNTVPELNLKLNFYRFLFPVWQEYRGLGTLDGMAHGANLMQWLYSALASFVLPTNIIRYVLQLSYHFLGGLGVFFLSKYLLSKISEKANQTSDRAKNMAHLLISFFGGLFYQFNLMTVQMFYVPLEVFSIHFAALPWGVYTLLKYLEKPRKKTLAWFALVQILSLSQAHVPSVFIVYALVLFIALLSFLFLQKKWKIFLLPVSVLIMVNGFWGFPYVYSALNKSAEVTEAKVNRFATNEIFYRNFAWGDLKSTLTFGGFNLDYQDWNTDSLEFDYMMGSWHDLYQTNSYQALMIIFSIFVFIGVIYLLLISIKKKQPIYLFLSSAWIFFFSMMGVNIPGVKYVSWFFREYVPYFHQVFRFIFTKFSLSYVFFSSLALVIGLYLLTKLLSFNFKKFRLVLIGIIFGSLYFFVTPAFTGNFFYLELRQKIPHDYFLVTEFFEKQDVQERVAILPQQSFYGWTTNNWGHRGSGFLWQMIPQPMMDRAFDGWSAENETFHLQLKSAITQEDQGKFYQLLHKHHIGWVLIDETLFQPNGNDALLFQQELYNFLDKEKITELALGLENIRIYKIVDSPNLLPISIDSLEIVDNDYKTEYLRKDLADKNSFYLQDDGGVVFPFSFLQREYLDENLQKNILGTSELFFSESFTKERKFKAPSFLENQSTIVAEVLVKKQNLELEIRIKPIFPEIKTNKFLIATNNSELLSFKINEIDSFLLVINQEIFILNDLTDEEKTIGFTSLNLSQKNEIKLFKNRATQISEITKDLIDSEVADCWKDPELQWEISREENKLKLISKNASACMTFPLELTTEDIGKGLMIGTSYDYIIFEGAQAHVCISLADTWKCLNREPYKYSGNKEGWSSGTSLAIIDEPGTYVLDYMNKITVKDKKQATQYDNVEFFIFSLVDDKVLNFTDLVEDFDNLLLDREGNLVSEIEIKIPYKNEDLYASTREYWSLNRGLTLPNNCDQYKRGEIEIDGLSDRKKYLATRKAVVCDTFPYPDLQSDTEYLLRLVGSSYGGSGLRGSLVNEKTGFRELDIATKKDSEFEIFYPLQFSKIYNENIKPTYNLNFSTMSFGEERNTSSITEIEFYPLPISWLTGISFSTDSDDNYFEIEILENKKLATFGNLLKIRNENDWNGVLLYPQAYDKAWIAIDLNASLKNWKILEHKKYNGWANAWLVGSGEQAILVIFWPQLLSLVGWLGLLGMSGWFGLSWMKTKIKK